ncbi:SapC family protein [Chromatiaceae bacterium AAb-1]|nr:SapC family protein [Chromatiaceae bacterium AAb-1]
MSHEILDNITHHDLKIITTRSALYGDNIHCTTAFIPEFRQLQAHYPIFLRQNSEQQFEPVVLLGFTEHENVFLGEQGWNATYIPLSIQRQPFLIGFQTRTENGVPVKSPVVCVDMAHPRVSRTEGEAVFLEHGGNSRYLEHISSVLATIQQGHADNQQFCQMLSTLELAEPLTLEFTDNNGQTHRVGGLYTINEDRLNQLDAATLEKLHRHSYLQHLYMMIASAINVRTMLQLKAQAK